VGLGQEAVGRVVHELGACLDEAHIEVLFRVAERDHHARLGAHVGDLLRMRLAHDEDGLTVPAEPDGHEAREPVRAERGQPKHLLGHEEMLDAFRRVGGGRAVHGWP